MRTAKVILIIARPGDLQVALQALVTRFQQVEVLAAADVPSAMGAVRQIQPHLVIVDGSLLGSRSPALIGQIRQLHQRTRCLALVDHVQHRTEALACGADASLVKGCPPVDLIAVVQSLLVDCAAWRPGNAG